MTSRIDGDWERTTEVIAGKRPATENGITWLRHRENSQAARIDLEVLKGTSSKEEIARKVGCSVVRVKSHLSHLQDDTHQGMASHRLEINTSDKVMFNLGAASSSDATDQVAAVRSPFSGRSDITKQNYRIDMTLQEFHTITELRELLPDCSDARIKSHIRWLELNCAETCFKEEMNGKIRFALKTDYIPADSVVVVTHSEPPKEWSDEEFEATVKAYLWMLEQETLGKPYTKATVNRTLREGILASRTKASIEFRMQNISAVLEDLCLPRIKGYLPAKNVGPDGRDKIEHLLANLGEYDPEDYAPTNDPETFEQKVLKLRKKISLEAIPKGSRNPQTTVTTSTSFARNQLVKAWVLEKAAGICEGCDSPAPFTDASGKPFLEVHHLNLLAKEGTDTVTNAVALCPNCHRRSHYSYDKSPFIDGIYQKISRLVRE